MFLLIFLYLFLLGAIIALVLSLNNLFSLLRDKVPYVSTPRWAIATLQERLSPLLSKERGGGGEVAPPSSKDQGGVAQSAGVVIDLGCGDARVLLALKKRYPHIKAIGYERNWWPFILAKLRTRNTGVIIKRENFYQANLKNADIVFCFLIQSVMPKVERLLRSQLKPGAVVYSYGFFFPTWEPIERITNPQRPQGSKLLIHRQ